MPGWLPGAGFKSIARAAGTQFIKNERTLFDWAKSQIVSAWRLYLSIPPELSFRKVSGSYRQSFISDHLNGDFGLDEEDKENTLSLTGFALYSGGGDTVRHL